MQRRYFTHKQYQKLFEELEYLKNVKRKEISKRIEEARQFGDLSENAEYESAKEAQFQLEKKISYLEEVLSSAQIIDEDKLSLEKVRIGVKVELEDLDLKEKLIYTIVNDEEADIDENKIGINSPVAQALLGKKENEIVSIRVPSGILKYKILKISLP